jgi:hypothetical protein
MGAIHGIPWEGPSDVQAKPKRPIASRGATVVLIRETFIEI